MLRKMHGEYMWHFKTLKIVLLIAQNKYVCGNFWKKTILKWNLQKPINIHVSVKYWEFICFLQRLTLDIAGVPSVLFNDNPFNGAVEPNSTYKRMVLLKCTLGYPTVSCAMAPSLILNTTLLGAEIRKYYKIAKTYIPWF